VAKLLPRVTVPTRVVHCRDDAFVPYEAGLAIAKRIPGARFVAEARAFLGTGPAEKGFI
jgi:pimeloyl-ACP methyl ester carboxylesterase